MTRATLRPLNDLAVPVPGGGTLPAEGLAVEIDLYWLRRLADGDVEIAPAGEAARPDIVPPPEAKRGKGDSA